MRKIFLFLLEILISLFAIEFVLRFAVRIYYQRWMKEEEEITGLLSMKKTLPEDEGLYKIICLGDSFTGISAGPGYSYPAQLQRILDKENPQTLKKY